MPIKLTPEQEAANRKAWVENERITKISSFGVIESVEERFETEYVSGFGDNVVTREVSLGYFLRIGGSSSIFIGHTAPATHFKKGATVKLSVTVEKPKSEQAELALEVPPKPKIDNMPAIVTETDRKAAEYRGDLVAAVAD